MKRDLDYAFQFYDPFTDQKLIPAPDEVAFADTRIPQGLLITIPRAIALVGDCDIAALRSIAKSLDELCQQASILQLEQWNQLTPSDYLYSDAAEELRIALASGTHNLPLNEWPRYMGVLSLAVIGSIYCELWPTSTYRDHNPSLSDRALNYLASIADRAAAYGVAFQDILRKQEELQRKGRETGAKAHEPKNQIFSEGIDWILSQASDHNLHSATAAAKYFLENVLDKNLKRYVSDNTARTLVSKFKKHIESQKLPNPFTQ